MSALDLEAPEPDEKPPKRASPRRAPSDTRRRHDRPVLEQRLREAIEAIAVWVRERGDEELGEILERDARAMADVCGKVAKLNPAAKKAVSLLADVLEPVRAFGPTCRVLWFRWLERRARRLEEAGEELEEPVLVHGPAEPELEREVAEPWRVAE